MSRNRDSLPRGTKTRGQWMLPILGRPPLLRSAWEAWQRGKACHRALETHGRCSCGNHGSEPTP